MTIRFQRPEGMGKKMLNSSTLNVSYPSLKTYATEQTLKGLSARSGLDSVMSQGWPSITLIS